MKVTSLREDVTRLREGAAKVVDVVEVRGILLIILSSLKDIKFVEYS